MREKNEEGSVHVRKDDRGITFVELLIAIAISTIILGAATLFLGIAHKNYNHASAQLDLQSESQILMEQLGMWIMEGNRVKVVNDAYATQLVVYQVPHNVNQEDLPKDVSRPEKTASKRIFWIPKGSKKLYVKKFTGIVDVDSDISGQYLREQLLIKDYPGVKEDIEVFLDYLKTGIGNLIDIFEPEIVCLGGSFSYYEGNSILDQLLDKIKNSNATFNSGELPKIVTAELKNDAGIIGAVIS